MTTQNNIEQTLHHKLQKIYRLSELGLPGERDNAARLLQRLLKKYGLTVEHLRESETEQYTFKANSNEVS